MTKDTKSSEKSRDKRLDNLKPFEKGKSGNPEGKKKGTRNFETIYREALKKIADLNELTPEELEDDIVAKAVTAARKGDYRFYKDTLDRLHGSATQTHKHEGEVTIIGAKDLAKKLDEALEDENIQDQPKTEEDNPSDSK